MRKKEVETIETDRMILRGITESDAENLVRWRSSPDVFLYFKYPHRITLEEHLNWYHNIYLNNNRRFDWIAYEKNTEQKTGSFGLIHHENNMAEVSYLLAPEAQHKGYATEGILRLTQYAAERWSASFVFAEIHRDNTPSISAAERSGFHKIQSKDLFLVYGIEVKQ